MDFFQVIIQSEKLVFSNYMFWSVKTHTYLQACDLWWDVFEKPKICKSAIIQEKKEKQALRVLKKAVHQEIWKHVEDLESPCEVWRKLEFICSINKKQYLPLEYWVQNFNEDEKEEREGETKENEECIVIKANEETFDRNDGITNVEMQEFSDKIQKETEKGELNKIIKMSEKEGKIDEDDEGHQSRLNNKEYFLVARGVAELQETYDENDKKVEEKEIGVDEKIKNGEQIKVVEKGYQLLCVQNIFQPYHEEICTKMFVSGTTWMNMEEFYDPRELGEKCYTKFKKRKMIQVKLKGHEDHLQVHMENIIWTIRKKVKMKPYTSMEMAKMVTIFKSFNA